MGLYLNTNVASLNAQRNLGMNTVKLNKTLERLSSGFRLNSAADGAGSLIASEDMRAQIRGTTVAMSNIQQGASMLNAADGALQNISEHLQRIREIAVEAGNGTVTDFTAYDAEYQELRTAIDNISANTTYNGQNLLDGSLTAAAFNLQIGPDSGNTLDISAAFVDTSLGGGGGLDLATAAITDATTANTLIDDVDTALSSLGGILAPIGGFQAQLSNQMNYLSVSRENLTAAEAAIRNTDIAQETSNLTRLQIMQQAGASALAQANQLPSIALRLLQ